MPYAGGRLLTLRETAEWLGVKEHTFRVNWRGWGLTGYRVGRRVMFREHEVQRWIDAQKVTALQPGSPRGIRKAHPKRGEFVCQNEAQPVVCPVQQWNPLLTRGGLVADSRQHFIGCFDLVHVIVGELGNPPVGVSSVNHSGQCKGHKESRATAGAALTIHPKNTRSAQRTSSLRMVGESSRA